MEIILKFLDYFLRHNRNLVTIDDFVDYASAFQRIIYTIVRERKPNLNERDFRFLIDKFEKGSVACKLVPYHISKDIFGEDPVEDVVQDFIEISELIDHPNDEETHQKLQEKVKSLENRTDLYTSFDKLIPKEDKAFQIIVHSPRYPNEEKRIYIAKDKYRKRLRMWRDMERISKKKIFVGVIKNLTAYADQRKFAKIIGPNNEKIKFYYSSEQGEQITKFYDREIIKVKGIYNDMTKTLEKIMDIEKIDSVEISELNEVDVKKPFTLKLSYEYGMIYAICEDYNLVAMGESYNEMLKNLNILIIDTLELLSKPSDEFTASSLTYRKNFIENFKLKKHKGIIID